MEDTQNKNLMHPQKLPAETSVDERCLFDRKGQQYRHGSRCIRYAWETGAAQAVDRCLSWEVKLDDRGMRLISRPAGFEVALTVEVASLMEIYDEAAGFAPESHPEQWKRFLCIGWEIWAENNYPGSVWLRGRNKKLLLQTEITIGIDELVHGAIRPETLYEDLLVKATRLNEVEATGSAINDVGDL